MSSASPNSSPSAVPPSSTTSPPPLSNPSTNSPPPSQSQPNATSDPPVPTPPSIASPPPQSSPPISLSPPPSTPPITAPVPPTSPPILRPPPSSPRAPPPDVASPPPPILSPPPPHTKKSPPPVSPLPPTALPPPPQIIPPSPLPIADFPPPPLPANSAPPSSLITPKNSPPPTLSPPDPSSPQPRPAPPPSLPSPHSSTPTSPPNLPSPTIQSTNVTGRNPSPNVPTGGSSSGKGGINTGGAVVIGILVAFVVLSLIGTAVWFVKRRKRRVVGYNRRYVMPSPPGYPQKSDSSYMKTHSSAPLVGSLSGSDLMYSPSEPGGIGNPRPWFTYEELVDATNGFSVDNLLGEGGFGCVYKGCLADGREVAVKQLKVGGAQGEREFSAEVETISRAHHRHLVSLVGYCISECQRLLVYDYVPNDTLYYHLHGEGRPVLDWAVRVKVATGAARGIAYLHEDCHPRIIHRDIKSSNILLDDDFEAQVSDFGLAKLALDANTHVTTRVMGTFGYMAPEYASSGKLTEKSDVYSFGVVLLELITGRKPVDASQPLGDESLVEWARPLLSHALENDDFEGLVDPRLGKNYVEREMFRMIEAAAACVRHSAVKRPRMGQVVRVLDCIGDSTDLNNGMRPGQSQVYDSAQQSAEIRMFRRMAFGSQDYTIDSFSHSSWRSSREHGIP